MIIAKRLGLILSCCLWLSRAQAAPTPAPAPVPDKLIQIGVEVVEVDENKLQQLGIEWLNTLNITESAVPAVLTIGTLTRDKIFADLHAMLQEGAADLLANPKLITRDGTTATFHVGGEVPYMASAALGTTTVEFKPYGVHLQISPRLKPDGHIALSLEAEVSALDPQNGVSLSGNTVPAISSRQVRSQIDMTSGTTLTLASLIQNEKQWVRQGVPFLGRIPLLGYLFSSKTLIHKRTSIVVFVTPRVLAEDDHA